MPKGFQKGKAKTGGRKPGVTNKLPASIKDRVLDVWKNLEDAGKGLEVIANKQPDWFYQNFLKPMLPKDVNLFPNGENGSLNIQITLLEPKKDGK